MDAQGPKPAPVPSSQIRANMEAYITHLNDGDAASIMQLYGDNPTVDDPVGGTPIVGRAAVQAFYEAAAPGLKGNVRLVGNVRVAGLEGAMPMEAVLAGPQKRLIDVIDTMKFDERGKIIAMRAYWNIGDARPVELSGAVAPTFRWRPSPPVVRDGAQSRSACAE